ncbi:MAG: hypothetical protein Q9226_003412 [Calogaya cf. arnoldii]
MRSTKPLINAALLQFPLQARLKDEFNYISLWQNPLYDTLLIGCITHKQTTLSVKQNLSLHTDFAAQIAEGTTIFTSHPISASNSARKQIDASALPLFTLRRAWWSNTRRYWLEFAGGEEILKVKLYPGWESGKIKLDFTLRYRTSNDPDEDLL